MPAIDPLDVAIVVLVWGLGWALGERRRRKRRRRLLESQSDPVERFNRELAAKRRERRILEHHNRRERARWN